MKDKRKVFRHNPMQEFIPTRPERPLPPFIRAIETTKESRVYSFQPENKKAFQIFALFPINEDEDIKISVGGEVQTRHLTDAISFVESNERQFVEAFETSRFEKMSKERRLDRETTVLDDETFQTL